MEILRRARLVWALLCIVVAGGLALVQSFAPQSNGFVLPLLWSGVWLWLPLYTGWRAIAKLAAVWFLGFVPLTLLADDPRPGLALFTAAGVIVVVVFWVASGLRRARGT